ncbi:LysR family transcriptional regulator [Holophaga foetida]|uniref:LysR family transcriptional regulator n=1 Tax=Holophaga foetida TaxID=35839 RepID=UPI0002474975|nr:LysR substrate-binding domain-containing protein [Holophaga foetida]
MEFRQIRYFVAVAEHLHFRRASEAMHIAQPSLSQQIHQLEEELGAVLFERNNRKVLLTPAGRLFFEKAKALLRDADRAREETRRVASGHAGLLSVSFITSAALDVLPTTLKVFQEQNPSVDLKLLESSPREQFSGLYDRTVDLALVIATVDDPVFNTLTLARPQLMAVLPVDHLLAGAESFDLRALASEVLIVPENHPFPGLYAKIHFALHMAGVEPAKELHIRLIQTGLLLVGAGLGISLVPEMFSRYHLPGIVFLPLDPPLPPVEITAVWRKESTSPLLLSYLEVLKAYRSDLALKD